MKGAITLVVFVFHLVPLFFYKSRPLTLCTPPKVRIKTKEIAIKAPPQTPKKVTRSQKPTPNIVKAQPKKLAKIAPKEDKETLRRVERRAFDISGYLRRSLRLPEEGSVALLLTIKPNGTIEAVTILQSESEKNSTYLEEEMKKLTIPLGRGKTSTITLTFCNDT